MARRRGYLPIDPTTPHSVIRAAMNAKTSWGSDEAMDFDAELKHGRAPHAHHNHVTGEFYGFMLAKRNPHAEMTAYDRLYDENIQLKEVIRKFTATKVA